MTRHRVITIGLILLGVCAIMGMRTVLLAQTKVPIAPSQLVPCIAQQPAPTEQTPEAGIKSVTEQYVKAFNAKNAKAVAALWTENGEFTGVDGEVIRGRAAIEKSLADEFQTNPKVTIEATVESVRPLGRHTAIAEGVIKEKTTGNAEPAQSRYSAMHVFEDGRWLAASVREWALNPGTEAATKHLDWLVGEWTAKDQRGNISIAYAWDENGKFLHGKYSIAKEGKTITSGTQVIGHNPSGGLRSWSFDSSGAFSNALWEREGNRWIEESTGTLSNGASIDTINVMIPLGADAFCWQTVERAVDGVQASAMPPIKVSRVKPGK
jgi:uncharacterized protein (TIGR02246 family)